MRRNESVFGRRPLPGTPAAAPADQPAPPRQSENVHFPDEPIPASAPLPAASSSFIDQSPAFPPGPHVRARSVLREWADALVIAIVLAMFLRVFILDLYQIPTGSMTPTLIGGEMLYTDYNGDGRQDLLMLREGAAPLLFLSDGERLIGQGEAPAIDPAELNRLRREHKTQEIHDRILVNKLAYWTHTPRRGDIIVFKVPLRIWDPLNGIYVKRCVGEPGDVLSFDDAGHLRANGKPVQRPAFFTFQRYGYMVDIDPFRERPEIDYDIAPGGQHILKSIHVPRGELYAFGDNTWSSSDSRYWGGLPINNVKGRAFVIYWPPEHMRMFPRN